MVVLVCFSFVFCVLSFTWILDPSFISLLSSFDNTGLLLVEVCVDVILSVLCDLIVFGDSTIFVSLAVALEQFLALLDSCRDSLLSSDEVSSVSLTSLLDDPDLALGILEVIVEAEER